MKSAKKRIPVFNTSGDYVIGEIPCGQKTLVLGETNEGTVIAYMLGMVKPQNCNELVDEDRWEQEVSEKHRLLRYASSMVERSRPEFIKCYFSKREEIGKNLYGDCIRIGLDNVRAGDIVFDTCWNCIGVYMGDGSCIIENRKGEIVCKDVGRLKKAAFGRPKHSDWDEEDVCYNRRLRKYKYRMCGDDVRAVQRSLKKLGYKVRRINSKFDSCTQKAVMQFQQTNKLEPDGVVDYTTWQLLMGGD